MKTGKLIDLLKKGSFSIPCYLYQIRNELTDSIDEIVVLSYLMDKGEKFIFNPEEICKDLNYEIQDIIMIIDSLSEKNLLSVDVIKNDKGIMEEYVILDMLYEKIAKILVEEINDTSSKEESVNVYEKIEESFGRPISAIEYEIIKSWFENGFTEELVLEALKEALFNGVTNLRYIDTILYEWSKKGIKTVSDVDKNRNKRREEKQAGPKLDLFDYDWFDEDE